MGDNSLMHVDAWDGGLVERLGDLTLRAHLTDAAATAAIPLVRRYGFAIVESDPCSPGDAAHRVRSDELRAFGAATGTPLVQSVRSELVEDVKDFSDTGERDDRGYRSGGELQPHSDPPTLILLHCLRPARRGGETSLVNVNSIVKRMLADDATLVDELMAPMPDWLVAGQFGLADARPATRQRPVLAIKDGRLSCVLYRPYIERAAADAGPPLTPAQLAALDLFERYSMAPDLTVRFVLRAGQTLVLHNRSVLHARTDYVDWPELDRRRHLLRMWIDSPDEFPVHPAHELGDFFAPPKCG